MARRPLIAGNWKMNTTLDAARALASEVAILTADTSGVDVVVIPPACFLVPVAEAVSVSAVTVGAQNMHPAASGAFTGELSAAMLKSLPVRWVLCGHSERRHVFGESADFVGQKVAAAVAAGLTPILCVGETLEDRDAGRTEAVVAAQLEAGLSAVTVADVGADGIVIAYEPVWAIGTGRTASPEQAQAVHAFIRRRLGELGGDADIRLQYGGSVKPANAAALLAQPDIDGALVGGASLNAESFAAIVTAGK